MGVTFGKYEIVRRIATGGMAEIFLARERQIEGFERPVVIKKVLPQFSKEKELVQMFLQEARTAALLEHPNVVRIYSLGQEQNIFYIAMEYVHGETISEVWKRGVQQKKLLPLPYTLQLIADAAKGLDHAHKKKDLSGRPLQIVHRDVSPQNVMVSFDGVVKIVDFGIAKAANKLQATNAGIIKGKFAYMSPEQARGELVDARSDIFALGILLYELTTGKRLFRAPSDVQTIQKVANADIAAPSERIPQYPKGLEQIVMTALAAKREARYQDAKAFSDALEGYLRDRRLETRGIVDYLHSLFPDRLEIDLKTTDPEGDGFWVPSSSAQEREPVGLMTAAVPVVEDTSGSALQVIADSGDYEAKRATPEAMKPVQAPPEPPHPEEPQLTPKPTPLPEPLPTIPKPELLDLKTPTPKGERQPRHTGHYLAEELGITRKPASRGTWIAIAISLTMLTAMGTLAFFFWDKISGQDNTAAKGTGSLEIRSIPGEASIYIDGVKYIQNTPTKIPDLQLDAPYTVKVVKDGFFADIKTVRIDPAVGVLTLDFSLRAVESVKLSIESNPPGASVTVDGVDSGRKTPTFIYIAPGDEHYLLIEKKGYEPKEHKFTIPPNLTTKLEPLLFTLEPQKTLDPNKAGTLNVTCPEPVTILLDGREIGKDRVNGYQVAEGPHQITLTDKRGKSYNFTIEVIAGQESNHSYRRQGDEFVRF